MPLDILIIQHAEKEPAPGDPGLTSLGHDQAQACGAHLAMFGSVDELWSSPLRRAVETAGHIAAVLGLPDTAIHQDDRIRERSSWPGEPHQSRDAFLRDWERTTADRDHQPAWGDSSRAAGDRFAAFLDECRDRLAHGRIIVVAHGGVTVDLVRTWFGDEHVRQLAHGVAPCAVTRIVLDGERRTLLGIGQRADATGRWLGCHG